MSESELRAKMTSLAVRMEKAAIDCDRDGGNESKIELSELRAFCRGQAAGYRAAADEIRREVTRDTEESAG